MHKTNLKHNSYTPKDNNKTLYLNLKFYMKYVDFVNNMKKQLQET